MDDTNTLIHMIFIPVIVASLMGITMQFDLFSSIWLDADNNKIVWTATKPPNSYPIPLILIIWSFLSTFYLTCSLPLGMATYMFGLLLYMISSFINSFGAKPGDILYGNTFAIFLGIHLFGWIT